MEEIIPRPPLEPSGKNLIINVEELTITRTVKSMLGKHDESFRSVGGTSQKPPQLIKPWQASSSKQPEEPHASQSATSLAGQIRQLIEPKPMWCPVGLSKSQKRRLQRIRTAELCEAAQERARDEAFNDLRPMLTRPKTTLPAHRTHRQEWRAKNYALPEDPEEVSEDDSGEEPKSPLIRDGSPLPQPMDISMVFTLLAEFKANSDSLDRAVPQLCLGPKAATFEKPQDDYLHLKPLYLRGYINGKSISRMLVDDGGSLDCSSTAGHP
jgi:hypothetical protein